MIHTHKRQLVGLFLLVIFTGAVLAGGRRERNQEDPPEAAERSRGDRIEFGTAVDRPEVEPERAPEGEKPGIWIIADHKLDQNLQRAISGVMQEGYTPVGMERTEEGISILYIKTERVVYDRWIIHEFSDFSALNNEFSAFLVDGWLPMGFSKDGESITTLFVRSRGTEIAGWRIHDVPAGDLEQLIEVVEAYTNRGYVPYGISIDPTDDRIWLLVLQMENGPEAGPAANVLINAFAEEDIEEGLTTDVNRGAVPWGMSRGSEASFFLYLF